MKNFLILTITVFVAACGGGGEGGGKSGNSQTSPPPTSTGTPTPIAPTPAVGDECLGGYSLVPCDSLEDGVPLQIGTSGGSGGYCLSGLFFYGPCDPMGPSGDDVSAAISYPVTDREPNNDVSTASIANFATRQATGQRTGFSVTSSVDGQLDGFDVFAFAVSSRRRVDFDLCFVSEGCGWHNPDVPAQLIGVNVASVRILDASGIEVFSTADSRTPGNEFKAELEGGVTYFLVIAAEAAAGPDLQYFLRVLESYYQPEAEIQEPAPEPEPVIAPLPPTLNAWVTGHDSYGTYVDMQLDWTAPLENEDGTVLNDLAGYNIYVVQDYYAPAPGESMWILETIEDPSTVTRTYDLAEWQGHWIGMTAFNSQGIESELSELFMIEMGPMEGVP